MRKNTPQYLNKPYYKTGLVVFLFLLSASFFISFSPTKISAEEVDILWQGSGYTPPFYKGRTLWANQTGLTIMAIPHLRSYPNRSALNYKWSKNNTVLGTSSGISKSSVFVVDSVLGTTQNIRLELLFEGGLVHTSHFTVTPIKPVLLVYENNPLFGFIFHKEVLSQYLMKDAEITFTAFPFFFTGQNRLASNLQYAWRTNQGETENRNSSTYRTPEGASGYSQITVKVENTERIMQSGSKKFNVLFER
jgi:hypothetical protein